MNNAVKRLKKKLISLRSSVKSGADSMSKNMTRTMNGLVKKINDIINSAADEETLRNQALFGEAVSSYGSAYTLKENLTRELSDAFKSVPAGFFDDGEKSAQAFCSGFEQKISSASQKLRETVEQTFSNIQPVVTVSASAASSGSSQVYNNASYNFYGSGLTVTQQLEQARRSQTLNMLRG